MPAFTDLSVQRFPEGLHFDTKLSNFGVRVGKSRRTWIIQKGSSAKRTKVTIGHYPAMSLADARKAAMAALAAPTDQKVRITFPTAVEDFLALPRWRPQSKRVITSSLGHFAWKKSLEKITAADVLAALDAIEGRSARHHALKDIKTFFNWCIPRYLSVSPCVGIKSEAQVSRSRVLTDEEIKVLWHAVDDTFGVIFKLLLLTGQRKSEIGKLRAEYIIGDDIKLPRELVKNNREHTFPIGHMAKALLPDVEEGYLFTSARRGVVYNGYTHHLKLVQEATGITGFTLHDLRRTYSTKMAELGVPIHVTEKILNHVSGTHSGVQAIYNRYTYKTEMRDACLIYEAHIGKLVGARA